MADDTVKISSSEFNNYIGQKLFAYIHAGKQRKDRIKKKF